MPVEMNNRLILKFRTILVVLVLSLLMALVAFLLRASPNGPAIVGTVSWALVAMATVAAGKSAAEHLSNGTGVKGAVQALMTDAKPGEPRP